MIRAFLLILAASSACSSQTARGPETPTVYDRAFDALFREDVDLGRPHLINVFKLSQPSALGRVPRLTYESRVGAPRIHWGDIPGPLRDSLQAVFDHPTPIPLEDLPSGARLRALSDSTGVVLSVSRVAFNSDSTDALVYVAVNCGPVCGGADIIFLQRTKPASWRVTATFPLWRS